jgi:hypothetical protein
MKSDKSKPHEMVVEESKRPERSAPNWGTSENTKDMDHDGDVKLGEGLEFGVVHYAHTKEGVRDAKEVKGLSQASRGHQARREEGHADPLGDCDCV